MYINLHTHTEYSNFITKDSTNRIPKVIEYVAKMGQNGYASTDHEFVGNHVKILSTVSQMKASGKIPQDFKVILGNEIYLIDKQDMETKLENKESIKFYHFILLAKDEIGHQQLQELSSRACSACYNVSWVRINDFLNVLIECWSSF